MVFVPNRDQPDFKRLKSTLVNSRIAKTNNALYQTINNLIDMLADAQVVTNDTIVGVNDSVSAAVASLATTVGTLPTSQSGTYTPTLIGVVNVSSTIASPCQWVRVGSTVTINGQLDVDPSFITTLTQIRISLPAELQSQFSATTDCGGSGNSPTVSQTAVIYADTTNEEALMEFTSNFTGSEPIFFSFHYQLV